MWSQVAYPAMTARPLWPLVPVLWPAPGTRAGQDRAAAEPRESTAAEPGFASYRSPGGHAAAKVLRPD